MNEIPVASPVRAKPTSNPLPKPRATWLRIGVRASLSAALLLALFSDGRFRQIVDSLGKAHLAPLLGASLLYGMAQVVSSWRWQWLGRPLGLQLGLARLVQLYFIGMFCNLFLPTSMGGDVVRSWLLTRTQPGISIGTALASVLSERLNGLVALLLLGCLATLWGADTLPGTHLALMWGLGIGGVAAVAILPLLGSRVQRCRQWADALSLSARSWHIWLGTLGLSVLVQAASIVQVALVAQALGLPVSWRCLSVAVPIATVASLLPLSIAGLGLREGSLVLLLAPTGINAAQSVALGLGWLAMQALTSLVGAPLWWLQPHSFQPSAQGGYAHFDTPGANTGAETMGFPRSSGTAVFRGTLQDTVVDGGEASHGRLGSDSDQGRTGQSAAAA
ncbi:hypothetical protein HRbin36_01047 [bacterium HR36]|nr:hypothetical protein HRbin36_01047 [bacterium HR36]